MTPPADFVSVVIPVYNGSRFLPEALYSVRCQDYAPLEVIVVDDGSTDDTPDAIASLAADPANRIRTLRTENRGPAAARNAGIAHARGTVIAFLDVDDLWPNGKLARQMARLARTPSLDIVHGLVDFRILPGAAPSMARFRHLVEPVVAANLGAGLFRKEILARVGGFDENMIHGEDVDLFLRAIEAEASIAVMNTVTLVYRLHDRNMMVDAVAAYRGLMAALRQSIARRRREGGEARSLPELNDFLETDDVPS